MNLFYVMAVLVLLAGFFAGYKAGFLNLLMGVLTTTGAAGISCCCFILLHPQLDSWLDFSSAFNIGVIIGIIFLTVLSILLFILKFLSLRFYIACKGLANRISGALFAMALCTGILIIFITQSTLFKTPALITENLEASGITSIVNNLKDVIAANLPAIEDQNQEIILAADNNIKNYTEQNEKNRSLPFLNNTFTLRPDLETEMLQLVNKERAAVGLLPLNADSSLIHTARKHSADMFLRRYFSHNTPEGYSPFDRLHTAKVNYLYAGENLAFAATLIKAHNGLMLSPGHRANILNKNYHKAGIGILEIPMQGLLITQEFKD